MINTSIIFIIVILCLFGIFYALTDRRHSPTTSLPEVRRHWEDAKRRTRHYLAEWKTIRPCMSQTEGAGADAVLSFLFSIYRDEKISNTDIAALLVGMMYELREREVRN